MKEKKPSPITAREEMERMTIRIPKDELEVAKALAQEQGISLNAYLLLLIHKSIFPCSASYFLIHSSTRNSICIAMERFSVAAMYLILLKLSSCIRSVN